MTHATHPHRVARPFKRSNETRRRTDGVEGWVGYCLSSANGRTVILYDRGRCYHTAGRVEITKICEKIIFYSRSIYEMSLIVFRYVDRTNEFSHCCLNDKLKQPLNHPSVFRVAFTSPTSLRTKQTINTAHTRTHNRLLTDVDGTVFRMHGGCTHGAKLRHLLESASIVYYNMYTRANRANTERLARGTFISTARAPRSGFRMCVFCLVRAI